MGTGAVQTLEGLVQNRNDSPLFFQRREGDGKFTKLFELKIIDVGAVREVMNELPINIRPH